MQAELTDVSGSLPGRHALSRIAAPLLLAGSRCAAIAAQFLVQVAVGAMAGPAGLGVLQLFASWSAMAGEGLARGLPAWAMRVVAVSSGGGNTADARRQLRWAVRRILRLTALVGLPAGVGMVLFADRLPPDYFAVVLAVCCGAPLFALLRLFAEALKGAGGALRAVTIENLVSPVVLLAVCALCWLAGQALTLPVVLGAGFAGIALALLCTIRAFVLHPRQGVQPVPAASAHTRADINALWANSVLSIVFLHLPFLVLPLFAPVDEIGVYAVAHKLVNVVTTLLLLLAAVFGPAFARAAATGGAPALVALLRRTQWISCAIFLPFCAVLLLAIAPLARLFNVPAATLELYLLILAAGHLVNAATGLSGVLLNMAGAARLETRALLGSLLLTVLAAPPVGMLYGATGLAVLFSLVIAVKNTISFIAARLFLVRREDAS